MTTVYMVVSTKPRGNKENLAVCANETEAGRIATAMKEAHPHLALSIKAVEVRG
jgi:hypothetical protein